MKQEGIVGEYRRKFLELVALLDDVPDDMVLGKFINGLRSDIKEEIRVLKPNHLGRAMELA